MLKGSEDHHLGAREQRFQEIQTHTPPSPNRTSCRGCSGCLSRERPGEDRGEGPSLEGGRLAWASAGLFVGPLFLAIVGATCLRASLVGQLVGAAAGLAAGMAGCVAAGKLIYRGGKETE